MGKLRDLKGARFGKLLVLERALDRFIGKNNHRQTVWLCKCDCGNEAQVAARRVFRYGNCGCMYKTTRRFIYKDLTGERFGKLTVVSKYDDYLTKVRGSRWICRCDCGADITLSSNCLTSGNNTTCGNKKIHGFKDRCGDITSTMVASIKNGATARNMSFNLAPEYLWELFLKQGRKCDISDVALTFGMETGKFNRKIANASLDRIDNVIGYEVGNVHWVHKTLNIMRGVLSLDEFVNWCGRCYLHNKYWEY
jgi:hypothetical protein